METTNNTPAVQNAPTTKISPLPNIIMVLGIIETVLLTLLIAYYLFLIPRLISLYQDLNIEVPNPYTKLLVMGVFLIFPLAEIYYGFWLKKFQKTKQDLPRNHRRIIYGIFIITGLLVILHVLGLFFSSFGPLLLLQQELR